MRSKTVFSTALIMVGAVGLCFLGVVMLFSNGIASVLNYTSHPEYIRIMSTVVALDAFQAILFSLLRFQGRAWKFALLKLAFIVGNIALNLFVFLLAPEIHATHPSIMGWYRPGQEVYYVFLINLICTSLVTLGFIPELRLLRNGLDRTLIKPMLRYTWPLLLLGIVGILNQVADKICFRFLVPGQYGEAQLGLYGACVKIAMIMAMITQAFRYAYEPFVFGNGGSRQSKDSQALVMKYFVIFTLFAFLAVCAYMDILRYIIHRDYWEGLRAVPIVMMAEIFMGIYFNLSFWYKLIEKTWWGAIMSAIGCVVLLTINIVFVPQYGYMACAWGGFCGYGVCMVLSYFIGQHYNPVPYPVKSIAGYFLLATAIYAVMSSIHLSSTPLTLVVNTVLLATFAAVVAYNERVLLSTMASKLRKRH